jgi:hypothetical protein
MIRFDLLPINFDGKSKSVLLVLQLHLHFILTHQHIIIETTMYLLFTKMFLFLLFFPFS